MPHVKYGLVAESVVIDQQTNRVSVINILESIAAHAFPVAIYKLVCIFHLQKDEDDPESIELLVKITSGETQLTQLPVTANFRGKPNTRNIAEVGGLVILQPGELKVSLFQEQTLLGEWTLQVTLLEPTPEQTTPS